MFGPETSQSEFFEGTMNDIVKTCINGVNGLVFTYGVTNAGKSFTVQGIQLFFMGSNTKDLTMACIEKRLIVSAGCSKDGGILPRSLDLIFNHVRGRQYPKMNIKPCFSNLTKRLNDMQVKQEESIKAALLASLKEVSGKHPSRSCFGVYHVLKFTPCRTTHSLETPTTNSYKPLKGLGLRGFWTIALL